MEPLRRIPSSVRPLLAATLLLGIGQQVFVVARNPLLAELGYRTEVIPYIQAAGAVAGVLSGVLATFATPRLRLPLVFAVCALLQAAGFALQSVASAPLGFVVGATAAGLAIQLNTAMVPPVLQRMSGDADRPTVFTAHAIALTALAGLAAALVVTVATALLGQTALGHRAAMLGGVAASVGAMLWFLRVEEVAPAAPRERWVIERPWRVATSLGLQGLTALAGGITLPFLQLYFKLGFGLSLRGVASVYAGTMAVGTVSFVLAPMLVRRLGLTWTVVGLQVAMLPLFLELSVATSARVAAAAFLARHALAATAAPLAIAFHQAVSHGRDGEAVAGLGMVVTSIAWAAGTVLAGPLLSRAHGGFQLALYASALIQGVVVVASAVTMPRLWRTRPA